MWISQLTPGFVFAGDYKIVRPLKVGGFGAVYVAEQVSTGTLRALKVMQPHLIRDSRMRERFILEAKVSGRIPSVHVVKVVGAGVEEPSGMPWLAMELLDGEEMGTWLERRGALPLGDAQVLFSQMCHAIGEAHKLKVVHRDLKPENIFIAVPHQPGAPFTVKVLDFGIAHVLADAKSKSGAVDTEAIGTPLWMAPEQTRSGQSIVPATDVWAIGLIAFRVLTGKVYWKETDQMGVMRELVLDPLVPASQRARELGCQVRLPVGFDAWFGCCVNRDIEARYADTQQAHAALAEVLAGRHPTPRWSQSQQPRVPTTSPKPFEVRPSSPPPRSFRGAALLGVTALMVLGTLGYSVDSLRRQQRRKECAAEAQGSDGLRRRTAACRAACADGAKEPCVAFGDLLLSQRAVLDGAPREAQAAYRTACDQSDAGGCRKLAGLLEEGAAGVQPEPNRALELYEKNCGAGDLAACTAAGRLLASAEGPQRDERRAVQLLEKACGGGEAPACTRLGRLYQDGSPTMRNEPRALELFKGACEHGDAAACTQQAEAVLAGRAGTAGPHKAQELLHRACEHGDAAGCGSLGEIYATGHGVPMDPARAREFLQQACDGAIAASCERLGELYLGRDQRDETKAFGAFSRACENGVAAGCGHLADLYMNSAVLKKDPAHAATLYKQACAGRDQDGCYQLAMLYSKGDEGVKQDKAGADDLLQRGCEGKDGRACLELGAASQRSGDGVQAVAFYTKGCGLGNSDACRSAQRLHRPSKKISGKGTEPEPNTEKEDGTETLTKYINQCTAGSGDVCNMLGLVFEKNGKLFMAHNFYKTGCFHDQAQACENHKRFHATHPGDWE